MQNTFTKYLLSVLLLGISTFSEIQAQEYPNLAQGPTDNRQSVKKSAAAYLVELEDHFKVSIAYQTLELEEIKVGGSFNINPKVSVEENLEKLLKGSSLTFKKGAGDFYMLVKQRTHNPPIHPKKEVIKAQDRTITGTVRDDTGETLPGVNIVLKGTSMGTVTDIDGTYQLSVPDEGGVLVFTYIGFSPLEKVIGDQSIINANMASDAQNLSEVIVTALGFKENKDKQGSTASIIETEALTRSGETGVINGMAGRASGVQINRSTGDPGAGSNIQIRGQNTITGSNQPLVIIDGVPMSNNTVGDARGGVAQQSRLNDINPEDVASMQVLKGASAAALWGSRAANGVIIITTKRGADNNKINVSFSSTASFDQVNMLHPLQTSYGQGMNGVYSPTTAQSWGDNISARPGGSDEVNMNGPRFEGYDGRVHYPVVQKNSREVFVDEREDAVFRTGTFLDNNLSISGGNEKSNFYLSIGDLRQQGVFDGQSDYRRSSVRFKSSRQFNDFISVTTNATYVNSSSNRIQKGDNAAGLYLGMLRTSPDFDSRSWIGDYYASPTASAVPNRQRSYRNHLGASANPGYNDALWIINEQTNATNVDRYLFSSEIVINPVEWFDITARGGIDSYSDSRVTNFPVSDQRNSGQGEYEESLLRETEMNVDIIGRVMKDLSTNVTSTFIVGFNFNDRKNNNLGGQMNNFIIPDGPPNFNNSTRENSYPYNSFTHRRMARLYSNVNLGFYDQLYVNISAAGESGSTFGSASQSTFYYPSADVAWIITEQAFLKNNNILSFGKLRASYGIVGIQPDAYLNTTPFVNASFGSWGRNISGAGFGGAFVESTLQGDPNLLPERKAEWELGTDFRFFDNRLSASFTYYQNKIEDLLLNVAAAGSTGFSRRYTNAGSMENKGLELDLSYNILQSKDLNWNVFANWSRNVNRVTDLAGTENIVLTGGALATVAHVGSSLSSFYGGTYLRNADGSLDLTETGFPQIAPELAIIGDPNPEWRSGLGTSLAYKNFSLNVLFEIFRGGDFYEGTRASMYGFGTHADMGHDVTLSQDMFNYDGILVPAGTTLRGSVADFGAGPVLLDQSWYTTLGQHAGQLTEQFVSDGSWTRLRELTLGYNLSSEAFRTKTKLESVNFSITARNPFVWTKVVGIDPETNVSGVGNARGVDYFNNPSTRSLIFSLRINY